MDRDIEVLVARQTIQGLGDLCNRFVLAGESDAEGRHHADCILIDPLQYLFRRHAQPAVLKRDLPQFDVEVAGEFVPTHLHRAGDDVRSIRWFSGRFHPLAPFVLQRQAAQHARLA